MFVACTLTRLLRFAFSWFVIAALTLLLGESALASQSSHGSDLETLAHHFFQAPTYADLKLSPDGSHMAIVQYHEDHRFIRTLNIETGKSKGIGGSPGQDISSFDWADDDQFVFAVSQWDNYFVGLWRSPKGI